MSRHDRDELATLIYYPEEQLALVSQKEQDLDEWFCIALHRLIDLCRWVTSKYTRSKVRKALTDGYEGIIRRLIKDESAWVEAKNPYYKLYNDPDICQMVLAEFGLSGPHSHIINGHVPIKAGKGESPIKGGGRLLVIDGGFCKTYQSTSGVAGYTLVCNSGYSRMVSHQPFAGRYEAIYNNHDIANDSQIFEIMESCMKVAQTDQGRELQMQVNDLRRLLEAYWSGAILETH